MLILLDWNIKWLVRIRWIYIIINIEAIKVSTETNGPTQFYFKGGFNFLLFVLIHSMASATGGDPAKPVRCPNSGNNVES